MIEHQLRCHKCGSSQIFIVRKSPAQSAIKQKWKRVGDKWFCPKCAKVSKTSGQQT